MGFRDLIEPGAACPRLDGFMAPTVNSIEELRDLERTLDHSDAARPPGRPLELHILIETALGMSRVEQILDASRRVRSVSRGVGDHSMSIGGEDRLIGGANKDHIVLRDGQDVAGRQEHWNDRWHDASARIAIDCQAHGVALIDGPLGNFSDPRGFRASTRRARTPGYVGKWALHPTQIALGHEFFSPSAEEVSAARRVKEALAVAQAAGKGAAQLDGRLIEAATLKVVDRVPARAEEKWT